MNINLTHKVSSLLRRVALAMTLAAAGGMASAGTVHVAINTANFGAASGYLDMQLSATSGMPLATATISNMAGFDSSAYIDAFGVTSVAGGYQFRNDTINDLFHAVTFGGILSFDLTFAGQIDPLTKYVSHFVIGAFDEDYVPLGNYNPVNAALVDFSWTPSLTANAEGKISFAVSDPNVSVIPEPGILLLLGAGLCAMALVSRRHAGKDGK